MRRFFQKERTKTILIGVIGTHAGVGGTHFCISLATYISSVKGKKVLYLTMNHVNELTYLFDEETDRFDFMGVSYRSNASSKDLSEEWNQDYDYMILDFGQNYADCRMEYLRCDKKIVVGSLCPWKRYYYEDMIENLKLERNYKNWDYYAVFGIKEDKKEFKKDFDISIRTIPFLEDAFHIAKEQYTFFQEVLLFS